MNIKELVVTFLINFFALSGGSSSKAYRDPQSKRTRKKVLQLRTSQRTLSPPLRTKSFKNIKVLKKDLTGKVTWQYEGVVLHREDHSVTLEALFNRDDLPFMDVVLKRNDRFVETFYTDRWYNIFEIYDRDDQQFKGYYCNIGKPAVIEGDVVSYVDLALDLWVSADGKQTVLDEDEFEKLNLDLQTRHQANAALDELKTHFKGNKPPR